MIQHIVTNPDGSAALRFEYDFDAGTTIVSKLFIADDKVLQTDPKTVPSLLRHPASTGGDWVCAVMEKREFGEPAFVQRWDWEVNQVSEIRIPCERFGLMKLGVSTDGRFAVADRCFDDPDQGVMNTSVVVDLSSGEITHSLRPMISNVDSPVFDCDNKHVALIHTDQGGCEARLYDLDDPSEAREFAKEQIITDFETGSVAFVDGGIAVWTVTMWDFAGKLVVYDTPDLTPRFDVQTPGIEEEDEDLEFLLSNSDMALLEEGDTLWIGGDRSIHTVDVATGAISTTALDVTGVVLQLRCFGDHVLAITHRGEVVHLPR